ncbi:MAG TPA: fibronectin type III domain-containing protein, partial [Anaerolineae bacterium]|nr:fibronectin type III domain-containing protein [Anaerolineae bacterium]
MTGVRKIVSLATRRSWIALLVIAALLAPAVAAQGPLLTRGPYLQSTTRDSTIVVWQTGTAGDSVVEYGEMGYTRVVSSTAPATTHVVSLTGLSAGTTYQYRIGTGNTLLYTSTLATAPDP